MPNGTLVPASYGGTKLVCVSLDTDEVIQTITFPPNVAYPESYFNDVRFDLRNSITESGKGVAYITDSSPSGKNGIVVVDLGTANSWRHLDGHESVLPEDGFVPFIWGTPVYSLPKGPEGPVGFVSFGSDGIAISKDGEKLYFGAVGGRMLWEVPTKGLRSAEQESAERVKQEVKALGERSVSDGFETDSLGRIWLGAIEQNGVGYWDEGSGRVEVVVRDPRINWVDTREYSISTSLPCCAHSSAVLEGLISTNYIHIGAKYTDFSILSQYPLVATATSTSLSTNLICFRVSIPEPIDVKVHSHCFESSYQTTPRGSF